MTVHPMVEWLTACLDSAEAEQHRTRSWRQGVPCPRCAEPVMRMSAAAFDDLSTELGPCGHVVPSLEWSALLPSAADRAVLARVQAERALVETWRESRSWREDGGGNGIIDAALIESTMEAAVQWLAYGHRHDFPGWREEWVPEGVIRDA